MPSRFIQKIRSFDALRAYDKVVDVILKVMAPLVIVVLVIGVVDVFRDLWVFLQEGTQERSFGTLMASILSIFVLIELFRSILGYVQSHRLKLTLISETAIVFLLREIMIGVYQGKLTPEKLLALAAVVLVVGAIRTAAVLVSPTRGEAPRD